MNLLKLKLNFFFLFEMEWVRLGEREGRREGEVLMS